MLAPPVIVTAVEPADDELVARLRRHVEVLAGILGERHYRRPSALEAAAAYVERELAGAGYPVESQPFDADGATVRNLEAAHPAAAAGRPGLVIGAHYDTAPGTPGADDNASAVAALIEVARRLRPAALGRPLRFVAFTNEEPPFFGSSLMGSAVHARRCRLRGEKLAGMLCLESLGYFAPNPGGQAWPSSLPKPIRRLLGTRGDFLAMVSNVRSAPLLRRLRRGFRRSSDLPLRAGVVPGWVRGVHLSDHASYHAAGYPAVMLTDTAAYRNPHYHRPSDLPATLDYQRLASAVRGVTGAVKGMNG